MQGANAPNLVDELAEWMASQIADQDATSNTAAVPNIVQSIDELSSPLFPMRRLPTAGSGSFEHAVSLMHSGAASGVPPPPPPMSHEAKLATVSLKLFGCTPAELPADLRAQLVTWFDGQVTSMEGYLRPGCVHLTVEAVLDGNQPDHQQQQQKQEAEPQVQNKSCCGGKACGSKRSEPEGGADVAALPPKAGPIANVRTLVERMLATGEGLWKVKTFVIQYINEVGLVSGGRLQATWDVKDLPTGRAPPSVTEVSPTVLLAGAPRAQLLIRGMNLLQNDTEVLCRSHGKYVAVESAGCADCRCKTRVSASCGGSKDGASALMERTCCGCCVSKLANLSLAESEAPSCCSGGSTPPPKPAVEAVSLQTLKVTAEVPSQAGVLYVDVNKKLVLAPRGGRILVVDDQDVYKELLELECSDRSAATAWSSALGVVYEWVGDRTKVQYAFVEKVIVKLLHAAIGAGLAAVARQLHGLLQAEVMSAAESASHLMAAKGIDGLALLAQVDQACKAVALRWIAQLGGQDGTTLLHLAVQSQKAGMLDMVLGWGVDAGQPWRCDAPGVGCVTPLHLAAVAADGFQAAQLVLALVTKCQPGAVAWREAKDAEGRSPADYAAAIGHAGLVSTFGGPKPMEGEAKKEKIEPASAHPSLPKLAVKRAPDARAAPPMEAPSTPRRCKCKGPCPCAAAPEPCASCCSSDEEEDGCCGGKSGVCGCCASMATLTLGQAPAKSCCAK